MGGSRGWRRRGTCRPAIAILQGRSPVAVVMTAFHRKEETMNIEFKCPQCGKSVECDETFRGQVAECPHCGKGIVIPREKPRMQMPKTPIQRNMGNEKDLGVYARTFLFRIRSLTTLKSIRFRSLPRRNVLKHGRSIGLHDC